MYKYVQYTFTKVEREETMLFNMKIIYIVHPQLDLNLKHKILLLLWAYMVRC